MNRIDELKAEILSYVSNVTIPSDLGIARRNAMSMEAFAESDPTINIGEWKAWNSACITEGRTIPPSEFKALYRGE